MPDGSTKSGNTQAYNKDYYAEHRDDIAAHRMKKYRENLDYRRKALERERTWREQRREKRLQKEFDKALKAVQEKPVFDVASVRCRETVVRLRGEDLLLFSSAAVAAALGLAVRTLTSWLEAGKLPGADFYTEVHRKDAILQRRWFTPAYVQRMYEISPYLKLGQARFFEEVKKTFCEEFERDREASGAA